MKGNLNYRALPIRNIQIFLKELKDHKQAIKQLVQRPI